MDDHCHPEEGAHRVPLGRCGSPCADRRIFVGNGRGFTPEPSRSRWDGAPIRQILRSAHQQWRIWTVSGGASLRMTPFAGSVPLLFLRIRYHSTTPRACVVVRVVSARETQQHLIAHPANRPAHSHVSCFCFSTSCQLYRTLPQFAGEGPGVRGPRGARRSSRSAGVRRDLRTAPQPSYLLRNSSRNGDVTYLAHFSHLKGEGRGRRTGDFPIHTAHDGWARRQAQRAPRGGRTTRTQCSRR
jgi:hypothetical protein